MKKILNKVLITICGFSLISTASLFTISCTKSNQLYRPNPILPISKEGFEDVDIEKIDIERYFYTDDLLNDITIQLLEAGYLKKDLVFKVYKNNLEISMEHDLFQNGLYNFVILNSKNQIDKIEANIQIQNSKHLADNFKITQLGRIFDYRPKSILAALMKKNLNSIAMITEIANQLIGVENYRYTYNEETDEVSGAILSVDDLIPQEKPLKFYGNLVLGFTQNQEPFIPEGGWGENGLKFSEVVSEVQLELGTLNSNDIYTVLMNLIVANIELYDFLEPLINDLDLDNNNLVKIDEISGRYEMIFKTKPFKYVDEIPTEPDEQNDEYDDFAHQFNDIEGWKVTFTYKN